MLLFTLAGNSLMEVDSFLVLLAIVRWNQILLFILFIVFYLYWTRRPSRSYAKAGMNRPAGVKTAHSCGHTSS